MESSKDESNSNSEGLEKLGLDISNKNDKSPYENISPDKSAMGDEIHNSKENNGNDNEDTENVDVDMFNVLEKSEENRPNANSNEEPMEECDETGGKYFNRALDSGHCHEGGEVTIGESNMEGPDGKTNEDDKVLSTISELVDETPSGEKDCGAVDEIDPSNEDREFENMDFDVDNIKERDTCETNNSPNSVLENTSSHNEGEHDSLGNIKNMSENDNVLTKEVNESKQPKESAFQRLASLGVIAEEKPVVEDKESILKKLASRGGISIVPAGKGPVPVSGSSLLPLKPASINEKVNPSLIKPGSVKPLVQPQIISPVSAKLTSIAPNNVGTTLQTNPKYKPGPKSAKAKKIKIDPGKSLDIDKDFNSLITFLSAGTDESKPTSVASSTIEDKGSNKETAVESVADSKSELPTDMNETSSDDHSKPTHDERESAMDLDMNDDRSFHETDSESHDGSNSIDTKAENDERKPIINKNKNVEEGSAEILLSTDKNVFYNKVQEFNRDMSIAALTVFSEMHQQDPRTRNRGKKRKANDSNEANHEGDVVDENIFEAGKKSDNGITILEALSATGLRSIRYAREIPGVKEVIANDLSEDAVETIKKNVEFNRVGDIVTTSMSDASLLMYQRQSSQEWYDAIDLDPYGCPSRFLDSAVQAVRDGGLLLITCTDMAILAGNSPESCYVKYGAVSLRTPACHEMALRIALQCVESHANRYGRYIVPLVCFSADFYIRLIVQVYTSPVTCKRTTSKLAMVYQCVGCGTHTLHPLGLTSQAGHNTQPKFSLGHGPPVGPNCFHCNHKHMMGGPIWMAPMYSPKFIESMLKVVENGKFGTSKRMEGMLEVIKEELPDIPLYYTIAGLCSKLHCQAIPLIDIRSAILNAGYRVSSSHASPTAIKTNAPSKIIWDIMRCWVHMNPVSQKRLIAGSVPAAIIIEPPNLIANFDINPRARPSSAVRRLVRYQQNPEKNWGPGARAKCNSAEDLKNDKRRMNQNKNQNKKHVEIIEVVTIDDEDETTEQPETLEVVTKTASTVETE